MNPWMPYLDRYRRGEWRDRILHDLILKDARQRGDNLTFLDIGCGRGFDGSVPLQQSLARAAGRYLGVEPDCAVCPGEHVTEVYRCFFEDAPLPPGSVDVAFAVMVLEHLPNPERFWDKLYAVLRDGGVFWGLTVDARHWFCRASRWAERLRIKELYLNALLGTRGEERYESYPAYYRTNSPRQIVPFVRRFRGCDFINFAREGQLESYLPRLLRPVLRWLDREAIKHQRPGTLLAVRVEK